MKTKSRTARVDEKMATDLFKCGAIRLERKLSRCTPRDMTMPKISNLATRCPSYQKITRRID